MECVREIIKTAVVVGSGWDSSINFHEIWGSSVSAISIDNSLPDFSLMGGTLSCISLVRTPTMGVPMV